MAYPLCQSIEWLRYSCKFADKALIIWCKPKNCCISFTKLGIGHFDTICFFFQGDMLLPSSSWKLRVLSNGPHLCILCIFSVQVTNHLFVSVAKLNQGFPDVLWKFPHFYKVAQVHQAFEPLYISLPTPCISLWNVAGTLQRPNGITFKFKCVTFHE